MIPDGVSTTALLERKANCGFDRVKTILSGAVNHVNMSTLSRPSAAPFKGYKWHQVSGNLQLAYRHSFQLLDHCQSTRSIRIGELQGTLIDTLQDPQVIDWQSNKQTEVCAQSASNQVTLSAHRTYLLAGMTGDLGQSVSQWMVARGARNLVLASRTPSIKQTWLDLMSSMGARMIPMVM